ncbi:DUF5677 domain-containing protein [Marinobacter oulmenensis]|uniref:Post-segregation antitoxin (Ccd killing protein) n=1 Tax=Marinobacter oulmenensis TaxID=643747 RepID=A0A840UF96_9GAMM|nr:DUF5677 domain-containing protein [Marinobacter oulmenensis]MBB5322863.1 post-segregation antitoxin (ccd killing protein) [Marinobacter oulmenensis]
MLGLQELFDEQIEKIFRSEKLAVRILEHDLKELKIELTDEQRTDLEEQFSKLRSGTLSFDFDDSQIEGTGLSEEEIKKKLKEAFEGLSHKLQKLLENIDETMQNVVDNLSDSVSESVLKTLEGRLTGMLEDQEDMYQNISDDIDAKWGQPLGLLQGLIVIADESAQRRVERVHENSEDDVVQDLLIRLHAKAIQISKEILTLLKYGLSNGAQARWRTLHEIAVIATFVSDHGSSVAEQYIEHEAIDTYKAAIQYNYYYARIGAEPISQEQIDSMKEDYETLLYKHGQSFRHDYGWAASALKIKRPTFKDIEASVELDHNRPYYRAASANVHGNPSGVLNNLGLLSEEDIILSGPSNIGLSTPAQSTIISLNVVTTMLLMHEATLDSIVIGKVISKYGRRAEDAFIEVESDLLGSMNK